MEDINDIKKETPHLLMWFSDGSKIPEGVSPLPENEKLAYITRLKTECAKLYHTKTPVYLVYMGRLLNENQKALLEQLQHEIPNLAVIDYEEVNAKARIEYEIKSKVNEYAIKYKLEEKTTVGSGGIADLVDFTRLVLLYNSEILRDIAQTKIRVPLAWSCGLIYRDFDVTLERDSMPDIPTKKGCMASLNFLAKVGEYKGRLIELAETETQKQKINDFFATYFDDLNNYERILPLFLNKDSVLTPDEEIQKQSIIKLYQEIASPSESGDPLKWFKFHLISDIRIENSFLATNKDWDSRIGQMILKALTDSPYAAVQAVFHQLFSHRSWLNEFLTPQRLGFRIGNDLTWKMTVKAQHETTTHAPPSEAAAIPVAPPASVINDKVAAVATTPISVSSCEYVIFPMQTRNHPQEGSRIDLAQQEDDHVRPAFENRSDQRKAAKPPISDPKKTTCCSILLNFLLGIFQFIVDAIMNFFPSQHVIFKP